MSEVSEVQKAEKENKFFAVGALTAGFLAWFVWVFSFVAIGFGVRGILLSLKTKNTKYQTFSIIGLVLGFSAFLVYMIVKKQS